MEDTEDTHFVASEHDKLVSAVSKLDKTQHITEPTRSEPTITNSEFNLIKRSNKLNLSDVAKVLEDNSDLRLVSKKLKKSYDATKVLPKPLEKPQAERIKRATGYEETRKKVGRWDPVVARSRTAEFTSFPIKHVETKLQPTNEFLARFELKSDLERELEEVDPPLVIEAEEEEEKIYPMSYEEMVEHRQHLAKIRAQQSYREAKAKRQSKIKSKKFHRVLKKERLKQQLKEFEELQKTNPEEALKKLEAIEKARALERHTLRHKNTGKWAKNKMIRAKYDKDVRQQLADQLAVSRGLTKKTQNVLSSDDEADDNEGNEDTPLTQDPMNPWMLKQSDISNINAEFDFGYKKYLKDKMFKRKADSETDSDDDDANSNNDNKTNRDNEQDNMTSTELMVLKQGIKNLVQKANEFGNESTDKVDSSLIKILPHDLNNKTAKQVEPKTKLNAKVSTKKQQVHKKMDEKNIASNPTVKGKKKLTANKPVSTSSWVVEEIVANAEKEKPKQSVDISAAFESLEDKVADKVEKRLKAIRQQLESIEKSSRQKDKKKRKQPKDLEIDNLEYLKFKNHKQKAVIDEELIETGSKSIDKSYKDDITTQSNIIKEAAAVTSQETGVSDIDPNRFIQVTPKYLNTALSKGDGEVDLLDDDDEQVVPKVNIEEVFEEDDVVASFRQEKEDEINKDKPEDIDLSLPGWGSWGGKGVKAPKRKKNRLILKSAPKMPRRDENKGDVIIKEYKDPKLAVHKVKEIPFPFSSVKDYEASIRAPIGNTFIPEKAHKKLIRPSIITKAGAIIEPMDEDELLVKKNRNFMNEKVLKILGQK